MSQPRPDVHQPPSLRYFNAGKLTKPWIKRVVLGVLGNSQFSRFGGEISRTTLRRVIRYHYGRKWRAMQRIPLSAETARQRLSWCQAWKEDIEELLETIFSGESTVQSQPNYKRGWVFRKPHEKFMKELVNVTVHGKSRLSIMVWGAIWRGGKSDIVVMIRDQTARRRGYTSQSYQEALSEGLLPIWTGFRQFQQDNARIHTSESTTNWLLEHGISWIDWPAHSPDLNPIEHIWKQLKLNIRKMFPQIELLKNNEVDRAKLIKCIKLAWAGITPEQINVLINSLPRRLDACIRAKGWYTKY
ncbi:Transposable element Tc1 transposase [Fusarium oxysporum f. sp. raphani]|uniref:Transposable element Tc1 transposase n=1 Tax=Fusarium oxysporum f. sp. raphani TaxID=96318 RepID=A0A8J5TPV1_FUSOX|nr:Transposable element Tc1 transposase [Fusarium oxysporum f. sp. raphani]